MDVKQLKALLDSVPDHAFVYVSIEEEKEIGHAGMYGYEKYNSQAQELGEITILKTGIIVRGKQNG